MGGVATKITKAAAKQVTTINIEERAHKVISKSKPTPAPAYPSTEKQIEMSKKLHPNFMEEHYKKDPQLDERLKQVFVSSQAQYVDEEKSDKALPRDTRHSREWDYGFWEPQAASEGKVLLRDALQFMTDHMSDSVNNNVQKIATQYKLDDKDVRNVLEYYRVFQILTPPKEKSGLALTGPDVKKLLKKSTKEFKNLH